MTTHPPGCRCGKAHLHPVAKEDVPSLASGDPVEAGDPFLSEEKSLALVLLVAFQKAIADMKLAERLLKAAESNRAETIMAEFDETTGNNLEVFTEETAKQTDGVLEEAMLAGVLLWGGKEVFNRMEASRDLIVTGVRDHIRYAVNTYLGRVIRPEVLNALDVAVTGTTTEDLLAVLRGRLDAGMLADEAYWRMVANLGVSRTHHYGVLRSAQANGYSGYRFSAIIDRRTSKICQYMDGREFWVADGISLLEDVATAGPEGAKGVQPWLKVDDVRDKSNSELRSLGVIVPPLHAHCRSTLIPLR